MTELGSVTKIKGKTTYIAIERSPKCETCEACIFGSKQRVVIPAISRIDCAVGDKVIVKIPEKNIASAPLFLYALPLFFLLIGALIGGIFNQAVQIILSFVFLASSGVCVYLIDKLYYRKKEKYNPVITCKAEKSDCADIDAGNLQK